MRIQSRDITKYVDPKSLEAYPAPDFFIFSDGSGYDNVRSSGEDIPSKQIGYSTIVVDLQTGAEYYSLGGESVYSKASVYEAEFKALLSGLATVRRLPTYIAGHNNIIIWYGDNQSLVSAVRGDAARHACPELWYQFKYYEVIGDMELYAIHIPRQTNSTHNICDKHSSAMRDLTKSFYASTQEK